ncbi:TrkH family potassium uptake protein [Bacillaceae bacterium]
MAKMVGETWRRRHKLTSVQIIVLFYLVSVIVSTLLLSLPFVLKPGVTLSFVDALFTAVSALSVTGLTVVNTAETFSVAGVFILALILQFGGIGIMTLGTFIWLIMGKRIGLRERRLIMIDQNQSTLSGLVILMRNILVISIMIELLGSLILGSYFLFAGYYTKWYEAYYYGFFSAVSAYTNAGFDIFGDSLFRFSQDYFVQIVNMLLIVLGAVGFPVLIEIKEYFAHRRERFQFSLYTKVTTLTFFALLFIGAAGIFLIERNLSFAGMTWHEKLFYSLFNSVTTRSCGLAIMDVSEFSEPTLLLLSAFMFIGASPSSVGGGIRTTTFFIALLVIYCYARGRNEVRVFRRSLHQDDITKAMIVLSVATILVFLSIVLLSITEPFPLMAIIFEVCSAFGTTGLSIGITEELSTFGKLVITALMFIGRIGIISFLFLIKNEKQRTAYHYPKERLIIG